MIIWNHLVYPYLSNLLIREDVENKIHFLKLKMNQTFLYQLPIRYDSVQIYLVGPQRTHLKEILRQFPFLLYNIFFRVFHNSNFSPP